MSRPADQNDQTDQPAKYSPTAKQTTAAGQPAKPSDIGFSDHVQEREAQEQDSDSHEERSDRTSDRSEQPRRRHESAPAASRRSRSA
jgi:hypothetical protein